MQVGRAPRLLLLFSGGDLGQGGAFICKGEGVRGLQQMGGRIPSSLSFPLGFHATAGPCSELDGVTRPIGLLQLVLQAWVSGNNSGNM